MTGQLDILDVALLVATMAASGKLCLESSLSHQPDTGN